MIALKVLWDADEQVYLVKFPPETSDADRAQVLRNLSNLENVREVDALPASMSTEKYIVDWSCSC
jgi:hypothetical protein